MPTFNEQKKYYKSKYSEERKRLGLLPATQQKKTTSKYDQERVLNNQNTIGAFSPDDINRIKNENNFNLRDKYEAKNQTSLPKQPEGNFLTNTFGKVGDWRDKTNEKAVDLSAGQSFFRGTSQLIDGLTGSRAFGLGGLTNTAVNKYGNDWMKEALTDDVSAGMKATGLVNELGGALLPMGATYKGVDATLKATRAGGNALARLGKGGNIAYKANGANLAKQSLAETAGIGATAGLGYNMLENTMAGIGPGGDKRSNLERGLTTTGEVVLGGGLDVAGRLVGRLLSPKLQTLASKVDSGEINQNQFDEVIEATPDLKKEILALPEGQKALPEPIMQSKMKYKTSEGVNVPENLALPEPPTQPLANKFYPKQEGTPLPFKKELYNPLEKSPLAYTGKVEPMNTTKVQYNKPKINDKLLNSLEYGDKVKVRSGRGEVELSFVKREGDQVVVKRKSGKETVVPASMVNGKVKSKVNIPKETEPLKPKFESITPQKVVPFKRVDDLPKSKLKENNLKSPLSDAPKREEKIILTNDKEKLTIKQKFDKIYSNFTNSQHKIGKISKDTKTLASNARQTQGTMDYIITDGLVDKQGKKIGDSLQSVIQRMPLDKEEDFLRYMAHKHNVARASEGKNVFSQFNSEESAKVAEELLKDNPKFAKPAKDFTKWINDFMGEWADDLVGKDTLNMWKELYPDYFPVNRQVENKGGFQAQSKRGFINQNNLVKKAKGAKSDMSSDIKNPFGNVLSLVNRTVKASRNNDVGKSVLEEIRKGGWEDVFEIIPTKQVLVDDINKVLNDEGIEGVMTKFAQQFDEVFRKSETGENIVRVMEGGKEISLKVKDIEYLKALQSLSEGTGKSAAEQFEKLGRRVTNPFKQLITSKNPLFAVFNIARDVPSSFIQGQEKNPIKFAMRLSKSFKEIMTNSKQFNEFVAQGGMQSGFFQNDVLKTLDDIKKPNLSPFKKAMLKIEAFNNITEATPRYMEYLATLEKGGTKQEAIYNAAEVTVNFARNGQWTKFLDSYVPYLNAAVQGLDRVTRQVIDKPLQTALASATVISAPQIISEYANKDNPNFKSLNQRIRDDFYLIPNKLGKVDDEGYAETFFRVPKTRQYGFLFGTLIGRVVSGTGAKGLADAFSRDSSVPVRTIAAPFLDLRSNKDWKGASINPLGMELDGRSNYLKYDERTSEIGKYLGKMLNEQPIEGLKLSPKEIDYLINSYTGIIGDITLPIATKNKSNTGFLKNKFIVDPVYSNKDISDFYDNMNEARESSTDKNINENIPGAVLTKEDAIKNKMNKYSTKISELNKVIKKEKDDDKKRELRKKVVEFSKKANEFYQKANGR